MIELLNLVCILAGVKKDFKNSLWNKRRGSLTINNHQQETLLQQDITNHSELKFPNLKQANKQTNNQITILLKWLFYIIN